MSDHEAAPAEPRCRICAGAVREVLDFGRQPVSQAFRRPDDTGPEVFFRLAVGVCTSCTMVQQIEEVPRDSMFHSGYAYRSCGSEAMRDHFTAVAHQFLKTHLSGPDPFVVEIGSNDGILLRTIRDAGVRHLGVDPSRGAAEEAADQGVRIRVDFFEEATGRDIRATDGPADLIFSANTLSHIAYIDSIFRGVDALLAPDGVFVFEDRYLGDILAHTYFDQIYDEHFYLFAVRSVAALVARFGFTLIDAEPLTVHGGAMRYTVARAGARQPAPVVAELISRERDLGLAEPATFTRFADDIERIRGELPALLRTLTAQGKRIVGYGATAKSATVTNSCGIGPDLLPFVCDSTPGKQGLLTPGKHIPVRPSSAFSAPYPDYALLFAWNHAEEIMAKEQGFRRNGGKWIFYVPDVHIV